jgi:putative NADH-flavin reductase
MKIGVIGASGKAGTLVAAEAKNRGHSVTAIVRNREKVEGRGYKVVEKDLFSLTAADISGLDAVVSAFGTPFDGSADELHERAAEYLVALFQGLPKVRLLVMGGAASLYTDPGRKRRALEDVPEPFRGVPASTARGLEKIRASDINWTYFSPAMNFDPAGSRTGVYTPGSEYVFPNKRGESYLSYADAAVAIVDELENGFYVKQRYTVVSEKPFVPPSPSERDAYYGPLKEKPVFEGLSRYRPPFNYELAGKNFTLLFDLGGDYYLNFIDGHHLLWTELDGEPAQYYYECAKMDGSTYFVNFELVGTTPRTGLTLILDFEQRLVTLCRSYTDFSKKYPTLVETEFDFGVIDLDGFVPPLIRHGYTMDLIGKRIKWIYSPEFAMIHVYYNPFHQRGVIPPDYLYKMIPNMDEGAKWEGNPYDETARYIKIKQNIYLVSFLEQNMSKQGMPGNSLLFLMDVARVHDIGRSFGHAGNVGAGNSYDGENYMFAAYGEFVFSDGEIEAVKNPYIPE